MRRHPSSLVLASVLTVLVSFATWTPQAVGQEEEAAARLASNGKKILEIDDYARWRTIVSTAIAGDGSWVSYGYRKRDTDDELHLRHVDSGREIVVERGRDAQLSDNGRFAAYRLDPPAADKKKLEDAGDPVVVAVEVRDLETDETWSWDDVATFEISRGSLALAVQRRKADKDAKHHGVDLILRYLERGTEELLGSVSQYAFNRDGTHLAYTVDAADDNGNGVYLVDLATGTRAALDNRKEDYAQLTWDDAGMSVAVLRGSKPEALDERSNVLLAFPHAIHGGARTLYDPATDAAFPEDFVVSERGRLRWNDSATQVYFGIKEQRPEPEKTDDPIADVNVFHWQDERTQWLQKAAAERDRDFTYLSVLTLEPRTFVRLADERMRRIDTTHDGRWAIGFDDKDYVSDWQPDYADIYRIDTRTGERTLMLPKQLRTYGVSPDGNHFLFWREGQMWDWPLESGTPTNLTATAAVDFADMEWDYFGERPAYGVAGWSADGSAVVLQHRYDLWRQPLDGSAATNLTGGLGARDEIELRYLRTDPDERAIDLNTPMLLTGYGQWTKKAGYFELSPGAAEPRALLWDDVRLQRPLKARDTGRFFYTVQDFTRFPDYWVADHTADGGGFAAAERITDANPFQDEYLWGHRVLFEYTNDDGVRLQGTLAIPDDYQAGERRPMLVRFYEKYSQDLHLYPAPVYRHSPNFAGYVSNGYLVMQPDVHFRVGSSHSDMLECVEAATRKVIELGYADPNAIALSGHSYSGGGSSYIAARSKMFAAVASGAAPINLTSEFNQLFVTSGQNNHAYDIYGQGRYGTDPYNGREIYEFESPITWVQTMDTPLLYLHGEDDGVVGYVQAVEWYNALRFNNKPVIFLSYPGEGHGLRKFENQIDFQKRLRQFFDHHLRDQPAPTWMRDGVPYLEKERNLRRRQ